MRFQKLRKESFQKNLAATGKITVSAVDISRSTLKLNDRNSATYEIASKANLTLVKFDKPTMVNCVILRENLVSGQNSGSFRILLMDKNNNLVKEIRGTTIGRKRILTFPSTEVQSIGLAIDEMKANTRIAEIEVYHIDESLVEH